MINDPNPLSVPSSNERQASHASAARSASSRRSLLLCGGGTGGHVYPALAVASVLPDRIKQRQQRHQAAAGDGSAPTARPSQSHAASSGAAQPPAAARGADTDAVRLVYVGSHDGMEAGLVARESALPFLGITAAAVRSRGLLTLLRNSALIARGVREAQALLRREQPAAILGTGGYVCFPLFVAARLMRVPTMIYLPDIVPGLAVKVLSRVATRVACSFEPSLRYLPRAKTIVTGYPVRPELFAVDKAASRAAFGLSDDFPVLLIYGGSRGARNINRAIEQLLPELTMLAQVIHVCGREGDETWLREAADRLPAVQRARYHLFPYLFAGARGEGLETRGEQVQLPASSLQSPAPSIVDAFGAAELAIARAGASTLAELPAAGLPAVLVPLVVVKQDKNADYLVERGAAVSVPDHEMLGEGDPLDGPLFREVRRLLTDQEARDEMARRSAALARPHAAEHLADALLNLTGWEGVRP